MGDAHRGVRDALREVRDAEQELASVRREAGSNTDIRDAALAVEKAIYDQAKAMVELRKQEALRAGKPFDAGDEAAAMAEELEKLVAQAPTAEIAKRLRDYIALLRKVPKTSRGGDGGGGGKQEEVVLPDAAKDGFQLPDDFIKPPKKSLKDQLGGILSSGLTGAGIGGAIGSIIPGIGTAIGAAIGAVIGIGLSTIGLKNTLILAFFGPFGPLVALAEKIRTDGFSVVQSGINSAWDTVWQAAKDHIVNPITGFFNYVIGT